MEPSVVLSKKEILGIITLALKSRNAKKIFIKLLPFCRLRGEFVEGYSSFFYSINFKKSIIPTHRLWNHLHSEAIGKTETEFLRSLNSLIEIYSIPKEVLLQSRYIDPETNEMKDFLTKKIF